MPDEPAKARKRFGRHFETAPPVFRYPEVTQKHLETPQRSAILSTLWHCDKKRIPCSFEDLDDVFHIAF
jgi:hypothetical protein